MRMLAWVGWMLVGCALMAEAQAGEAKKREPPKKEKDGDKDDAAMVKLVRLINSECQQSYRIFATGAEIDAESKKLKEEAEKKKVEWAKAKEAFEKATPEMMYDKPAPIDPCAVALTTDVPRKEAKKHQADLEKQDYAVFKVKAKPMPVYLALPRERGETWAYAVLRAEYARMHNAWV